MRSGGARPAYTQVIAAGMAVFEVGCGTLRYLLRCWRTGGGLVARPPARAAMPTDRPPPCPLAQGLRVFLALESLDTQPGDFGSCAQVVRERLGAAAAGASGGGGGAPPLAPPPHSPPSSTGQHGASLSPTLEDADIVVVQHRQQPQHESALDLLKVCANPLWVLASAEAGRQLPHSHPVSEGARVARWASRAGRCRCGTHARTN